MTVNDDVKKIVKEFNKASRYIGVSSSAAVILGKVLGKKNKGPGIKVTLGSAGNRQKWPLQNTIKHTK